MSADDLEVAKCFRAASRAAVETGDREGFYACFADDVEYTTLFGTVRGIRELREQLYWASGEPEDLHVEITESEWQDLGGGHVVCESRRGRALEEDGRSRHDHPPQR